MVFMNLIVGAPMQEMFTSAKMYILLIILEMFCEEIYSIKRMKLFDKPQL